MTPDVAQISAIDNQLRSLRRNRDDAIAARKRTRDRINDLRDTQTKLNTLLDSFCNFPDDFSNLHSPVINFDFQGSRRRNIEAQLNGIGASLRLQRDHHDENLHLIQNQINIETNAETSQSSTINSLNAQITALVRERRLLALQS